MVMKENKCLNRIADKTLDLRLEAFDAVQISGPKWCGKTTTAERRAESALYLYQCFVNLTYNPDKLYIASYIVSYTSFSFLNH